MVEFCEHLFRTNLSSDKDLSDLGEDLILPPKDRIVALQTLSQDFDLRFKVAFDVLVDLVVELSLFVLPPFFLEDLYLLIELDLFFDKGVVFHLRDIELAADLVVVSERHRVLELIEQNS